MKKPEKITVAKAAELMGKSQMFVRIGMQRGVLPIGEAMMLPGSTRWCYYISPTLLRKYIGAEEDE